MSHVIRRATELALDETTVTALRAALRTTADEVVQAIIDEVPPYANALSGSMGGTIRRAVRTALGHYLDLASGKVTLVPPPPGGTLVGMDGLIADGPRRLVGVQNGIVPARVIRIELSADGARAVWTVPLLRDIPGGGEPTLLTRGPDGIVVVAGSPWGNYLEGRPRTDLAWPHATLRLLPPEPR